MRQADVHLPRFRCQKHLRELASQDPSFERRASTCGVVRAILVASQKIWAEIVVRSFEEDSNEFAADVAEGSSIRIAPGRGVWPGSKLTAGMAPMRIGDQHMSM
jgi:hypothetical protein